MLGVALKIALGELVRTVCYVERESYAASALVARMEDAALDQAPVWDDLRTFDGKPWRGLVEIITAGYPCQPFSTAGRRAGENDPRHLWPEVARITRETQPVVCFLENVEGHLSMGFETVVRDLQRMGYRVAPGLYTAAEVGAGHRRRRLIILAYSDRLRRGLGRWPQLVRDWPCLAGETHLDVADAGRVRLRKRQPGQSLSGPGVDRTELMGPDEGSVADTDDTRSRARTKGKQSQARGGRRGSEHESNGLANSGSAGLPVPELTDLGGETTQEDEKQRRAVGQLCGTPVHLFAPGPDDADWQRILSLDPSLEPAICGVGDGVANRVDRLRLCGNGVVPLAAAYAFISLLAVAIQSESEDDLSSAVKAKRSREPRGKLAQGQYAIYSRGAA